MIVGIDNGSCSGAMCILDKWGDIVEYHTLPACREPCEFTGKMGKTKIDILQTVDIIENYDPYCIGIEKPLHFAGSIMAMRSMALCYGSLEAMCKIKDWPLSAIPPRVWQNRMLGKFGKGQSKEAALAAAQTLVPEEDWIPKAKQVAHSGVIDAYLIARFTWENNCK